MECIRSPILLIEDCVEKIVVDTVSYEVFVEIVGNELLRGSVDPEYM
jgi:hypothetical protein